MSLVEQKRTHVISKELSVTKAASDLGVTRKTVHIWLLRYRRFGIAGIVRKRKRGSGGHNRTTEDIEQRVIELATTYPADGVEALSDRLSYEDDLTVHPTTLWRILKRNNVRYTDRWKRTTKRWKKQLYAHKTPGTELQTDTVYPHGYKQGQVIYTAPTVAEPTQYHYYACIEENCVETPATVTVRPQEPTETPAVTIQTITATPTTVESGGQLSLSATARNTTNTTAPSETIRFYRHAAPTATPTKGGTRLSQTTTTGTLAPGASVTRTVTRTVRTVTEPTTYHYYACTDDDCAGPATVTIQLTQPEPTEPEPTQPEPTEDEPNLVIQSITASNYTPAPGTTVTFTVMVKNNGTVLANSVPIRIYKHTTSTGPAASGELVSFAEETGVLPAGAMVTKTVNLTVPSSATLRIYYYACVGIADKEQQTDDNCFENPVALRIQTEGETPVTTVNPDFPMGGDVVASAPSRYSIRAGRTVVSLGGLELVSGDRGFVTAAHELDSETLGRLSVTHFGSTGTIFGLNSVNTSEVDSKGRYLSKLENLVGKTLKLPRIEVFSHEILDTVEGFIKADAAFIAYPHPQTQGCLVTWEEEDGEVFCLDVGIDEHIERIVPLAIRGKDDRVLKVIGSRRPTKDLEISISAYLSGVLDGRAQGERFLGCFARSSVVYEKAIDKGPLCSYQYAALGYRTIPGDSSSPIYTTPDKDGNVYIVGIHTGTASSRSLGIYSAFHSWHDVTEALGLKPIEDLF